MKTQKTKLFLELGFCEWYTVREAEEDLTNDKNIVVIDKLRSYAPLNQNESPKGFNIKTPIFATTHTVYLDSGISFNIEGGKLCSFDSGEAGYILSKEDPTPEDLKNIVKLLNAFYNNCVYELNVIEKVIESCDCCGHVEELHSEIIDSILLFGLEDLENEKEYFFRNYKNLIDKTYAA